MAAERGVAGWVRNTADGRVEAVFEGVHVAVDLMIGWCRSGPSRAVVTGVEVVDEPPVGEAGFFVR
jgi:acylphosphatase